jgi:hypothetical protein
MEFSKKSISYIIVANEIMVLIVIIIAYNTILYMQNDFSECYDLQTVEARDFTIVIK